MRFVNHSSMNVAKATLLGSMACCLLWCQSSQGQTVVGSSLSLAASADVSGAPVSSNDSSSQGTTLNPLSAKVDAFATDGRATLDVSGSATATWTAAYHAQLTMSNFGWTAVNVGSGSALLTGGLDWTYTFVADATGNATIAYQSADSGSDTFGLNGFSISWSSGGFQFVNSNDSGSFSEAIIAGTQYTVTIKNQANISGGLVTRDAYMTGNFDLLIDHAAAVPEPGTIAMLGGMVLPGVGYVIRRRKR